MKTQATREETSATQRQPAAQDASARNAHGTGQAMDESPRMLAQRRQIENIFGPAAQRQPIHIGAAPQPAPFGRLTKVAQLALSMTTGTGTRNYFYGADFTRDHIGTKANALSTLQDRWNNHRLTSPVTAITALDGHHDATNARVVSGYDYSVNVDVAGWSAYWNSKNKPVALPITSATLSGYFNKDGRRITHISSSG